jgi:hypothetical protein
MDSERNNKKEGSSSHKREMLPPCKSNRGPHVSSEWATLNIWNSCPFYKYESLFVCGHHLMQTWHGVVVYTGEYTVVCTFASNDTGKNGNTYSQLTSYIVTVILSMQACVLTSLKQASLKAAWNRCASCLRKGLNNVRSKWASRRHQR